MGSTLLSKENGNSHHNTLTIEEVKVMSEYEVWIISTITFLRMTSMKNDIDIIYDVLINVRHKHNSLITNILIFNCR